MNRSHYRRLGRLEKLATPAIKRVKKADEAFQNRIKEAAEIHAYNLAALVLYGDPKVGEPLSEALRRCCQRFPKFDAYFQSMGPTWVPDETMVVEFVKEQVDADLAGSTRAEKLQNLFYLVPPWLIWFTFADFTARKLGIKLSDLTSVKNCARSLEGFKRWPALPDGRFEFRPWEEDSFCYPDITIEDAAFVEDKTGIPEEALTRLERKRYREIVQKFVRKGFFEDKSRLKTRAKDAARQTKEE